MGDEQDKEIDPPIHDFSAPHYYMFAADDAASPVFELHLHTLHSMEISDSQFVSGGKMGRRSTKKALLRFPSTDKQWHNSATRVNLKRQKQPRLESDSCTHPPEEKTSEELEQEELENVPAVRARQINRKIFCNKGALGVLHIDKHHITTPVELQFPANEHLPILDPPIELSLKLSLKSEPWPPLPHATKPQPFDLATEDRGVEKERKFMLQLEENERKEQEARIPKANPLPYTTDSPVIPRKPHPKKCTKPEPFRLESVIRHEEELQRIMEERERLLREEAEMMNFRARPIMSNFLENVCQRVRMPLTEVQEFHLHVDARAAQRAEFDRRVKEKEELYRRLKAESEAAMKAQEEQTIKNMRKAMVPHVRPVPDFSKPFVPQRTSKEPTQPKSPKFHVLHKNRRNQNKMR